MEYKNEITENKIKIVAEISTFPKRKKFFPETLASEKDNTLFY